MTREDQFDFYLAPIREAIARAAWRFECEMIDRYNAAGVVPLIEKLTFEQFEAAGKSTDSGQKMPLAHRVE